MPVKSTRGVKRGAAGEGKKQPARKKVKALESSSDEDEEDEVRGQKGVAASKKRKRQEDTASEEVEADESDEDGGMSEKEIRLADVRDRFISMCEAEGGTMSDEKFKKLNSRDSLADLADVINQLLTEGRLHLYSNSEKSLHYRLLDNDVREMLKNLSDSDMSVYDAVSESERKGIWIKDLKRKTRLQDKEAKKSLKLLQSRGLIKSVRSIAGKNRRVYMLSKLEPSRDVVGGAWYSEGDDFDGRFVQECNKLVFKCLTEEGPQTADFIAAWVTNLADTLKLFNDDTSVGPSDLANLVYAMELDGTLKKTVQHPTLGPDQTLKEYIDDPDCQMQNLQPISTVVYEISSYNTVSTVNYRGVKYDDPSSSSSSSSSSPLLADLTTNSARKETNDMADNTLAFSCCVTCPVAKLCVDGGVINAKNCPYLKIENDTAAQLELF
jgi:predicted transcriptional regulator